ncbi:MAG: response regulator [Chloroflexota bacterium]|nr:response regulator [Chloroflexota bacterium]
MAKQKVLVVDDDIFVVEGLIEHLQEAGYSVVASHNAREAIGRIREEACDVALVDMKMPEIDGFQAASILRQIQPDLRVIMLTGYPSVDSEVRAAQMKFYEYLPKSNWYDLLLPAIERALTGERPAPKERPADLEKVATQYISEGKHELAALALEQAARLAEFTHEWERAAKLYDDAFKHMRRARGLTDDARQLRDLAESAREMAQEASA